MHGICKTDKDFVHNSPPFGPNVFWFATKSMGKNTFGTTWK